MKIAKFSTKSALFRYFWAGIFKKNIVIFEINTLKFVNLQNFARKTKIPEFGTKNALLHTWVFLDWNFKKLL